MSIIKGPLFPKQLIMKLSLDIIAVSPLSVGAGKAETFPGVADMPVIRDPRSGAPIISGSTIKGFLRGYISKVLSGKHPVERVQGFVEKIFGSHEQASLAYFEDAYPEEVEKVKTDVRTHVRINPLTGGVANLFTREYVVPGAKFETKATLINTPPSILGLFHIIRRLSEHGLVRIGGAKSRGYGQVRVELGKMSFVLFTEEDSVALNLLGGAATTSINVLKDDKIIKIEEKSIKLKKNYELHYTNEEDHGLYRVFYIENFGNELERNCETFLTLLHDYIQNLR